MDELEISGKRYISSRRAARQYKYHSDYIGQLIRGGKVVGAKVGRAWYVETKSLATYLGQEEVFQSGAGTPAAAGVPGVVYIGKPPVQEKKIEPEPSGTNYVAEKILTPHIVPVQKIALTYIPDTEPFLPEVRSSGDTQESNHKVTAIEEQEFSPVRKRKKQAKKSSRLAFLLLTYVGAAALGLSIVGANFIVASITVEQGKPASVGYFLK